jgi:hypothetical protein
MILSFYEKCALSAIRAKLAYLSYPELLEEWKTANKYKYSDSD